MRIVGTWDESSDEEPSKPKLVQK
nr:hypothetical protein [Tanacetum cinerariifolium]